MVRHSHVKWHISWPPLCPLNKTINIVVINLQTVYNTLLSGILQSTYSNYILCFTTQQYLVFITSGT